MDAVRHALIRADQIDLVEDPRFVPLMFRDEEGEREIPIPSAGLPVEDRLIVREFVHHLRAVVESLAPKKAAVLRLRYRDDLTAREIAAFAAKTGMDLVPGKKPADVREQDVYPVLHGVFLEILASLKERYRDDFRMGPAHLKEILEDVGV
jgi:hypothetical protein